jgi:gliding motility-associated-like protein
MVISQNITAPIANAGVDTILYCNRTTINWSATSNVAGATYVWSNGATTAANTTTVPNTYTVTVTNPLNGCTASDAMVISQNITAPVANAGVDTILYCNRTTINWSATSNVAGATYAWSNGSTTAANTTTVPNTYTVTVTNPLNGCTASDAMVIVQDLSIPNINAGIDTVLNCVRTSLNLNATSSTTGVTFEWSNGATTSVANVSLPNTYTVTATDPLNGCTASDAVVVTQNLTAPIANAGVDTILYCNRTTINWTATSNVAGATYAWSNGSTTAANTTTVPNTYTVTVTNPYNGCTANDAMVISQNLTAPGVNAGIDTVVNCVRTSLNLSATSSTSGATFAWSNGANTAVTNVSVPTTYTVTATHPINGCTSTDAVVVGIDTVSPNANAGVDTVINCTNPTISLLGSSSTYGVTVAWTGPGIVSGANTYSPVVNDAGLYTMTITNVVSGCVTTDGVNVSANFIVPNAEAGNLDSVTCSDVQINLQGSSITSNVSYSWSGPGIVSGANTSSPLVNTAGLYTLTVTSLTNGCSKTDTVSVIQEITTPQVSAGADTTLTCVRTNLNLTATSSTPSPIGFAWSNGATTAVTNVNTNNTYTVTATNLINGCTVSDAVVVSMDTVSPGVNAGIDTVVNCVRTSLNLSATSSTSGATFAWSNGANTAVTNVSVPTTYTVTATHPINGCTSTDAVVVGIDTVSPNANAGVDTVINCTNPTISLLGSSSTYGVTVAWTGPGIVSGANTYSPVVNDAGLYTMTITNVVSGCVTTDGVNVSANFIVPNAEAGNLDSVTCSDVQINLQGSSITSNVSYSWSGPGIVSGANTSSPLVNTAGLYTLTVTSLTNGCSKTDTVSVIQEITTPQVSAGADTTLTCVRTNLNLTATSSTPSPIGFAWSNGATTAVTNVNTNNTYTVTATNLINGCTVSDAVVVSMDTVSPGVNAGIDTVVNCVRTSLNLSATSSTSGATFAWSNGANTAVTNVSVPTTYTVTATHPINGCTSTDAVVVGIDTVSPNANAGVDTVINCTNPTISLLGSSSTYGVTVAWTGPGIVSGANTYSPVVNDAGLYTMTITNVVSGCVTTDGVNVSANFIVPNAEAGNLDSVTCADVQINLQGSSITSNVSYSWSGPGIVSGANTSSPLVNTAGLYTLTVTSLTNGCSKTDTVSVIQEITTPQVSAGADTTLTCVRTNLNLTATSSTPSPIGFAWSNGATTAVTNVNTNNTYTVTATNLINGCTVSDAVVVSMDTVSPGVNAGIDTVVNCVRTSLNLSATSSTSGATFAWSNGANTAVTNVSVPTTYTVTATHPINGCTSTDAVVVGIDTVSPNANAGVDTVINCTNPTISLLGSSSTYGVTVAWTGPGIVSGANTYSPVVNDAGLYTMTITNVVSGCVTTDGVNVSANFIVPNAEAGNLDSVTCADVQINLQGSSITSNVSYSWSGPGIVSGANTSSPLVNTAGLYTLTVTSLTNGCSKTDTVSVIQEITTPQVSAGADTTLTCVRTNLNLTATSSTPSPIGFAWSNGASTAVTNVNTNNTYTVTATNLINGCTVSDAVVVSMDTVAPVLNAGLDTILNCVRRNLSLQASSNIAGATYQWSNGVSGIMNPITTPNIYRVTATHPGNGCVSTDAVIVVIDTTTPDINAGLDTTIKCYRRSVVLNATSSVPNMNYVWSNGTVGASNTVSAANMYTVIGQNPVNGCVNRDAVIVNIDTVAPNANAGPDKIVNCIKTSETLNASSTTPNVTYLWSNGTTTAANTVSTTIAYTVTVTNPFNGCTASDVAVLTPDTVAPGANAGADKDLTCTITSVSFTATSPTANVSFQWSNGITGQNITVSIPNTYAVTVTSLGNGCTSTDAVNANLVPPPTITYDVLDNPCPQVAKGHIVPMISGGKAPFTYTWNNGSHASALSGLHGGGYAVTITDANGCVITDTFNLVEKQFILDVTADQTEIELGEEVHFNSNITGGTGMESITWNPGIFLSCDTCKNPTAGPMKSVKYNIVAVDTNGCSSTDTISIQVTPKYDLFVPNAFSPNNDGSNDVYEIFGNKKIWAEVEFKIFNRWGELIFESRDHEFKWDGTFKGEMLTPQVVVYEFKVVYVDGYSAPTQKGSITLIR